MKLASVEIRNFRAIEEMTLPLHPQLTVLHGPNAQGKTSVLRAIAVGLGAIPKRLPGVGGIGFANNDLRRGSESTYVVLHVRDGGSWSRKRESVYGALNRVLAKQELPGTGWLNERLDRIVKAGSEGDPMELPMFAFYDTDRTVLDVPQRRRGFPKEFERYGALSGALSARVNFREFFQWFYVKQSEEAWEKDERKDFGFRLADLSAVRAAISSTLGDVSNPRIRVNPLRFEVTLLTEGRKEQLELGHLSGGYRATLVLVADLARRMAQGNPHLDDPLRSEAVVLIDEVDLHLHPAWQQRILPDLTRTFPNAQFVVTTHSPQLLTTVRSEQVVTLARQKGRIVARTPGWGTYGAEAGDVLRVVMGVQERPDNTFSQALSHYRRLVSRGEGEGDEARRLRAELDEIAPDDPALASADLEIRQRKLFQKMAESR